MIPVGAVDGRPDYDYADGVTLRAYQLPDDASVTTVIPAPAGREPAVFVTSRRGGVIRVAATGTSSPWQVLLIGVHRAGAGGAGVFGAVEGGAATPDEQGTLVRAEAQTVVITLA